MQFSTRHRQSSHIRSKPHIVTQYYFSQY